MFERVTLDRLKRGIETPSLFGRELNRQFYTRLGRRSYNVNGIDVFAEDWDNLIILDACRFDMFAEQAADEFDGTLEHRISRGSSTIEWLRGNVEGREFYDAVYVTANPQYEWKFSDSSDFHAVHNVWDTDAWDEDRHTVPPDSMTDAVVEAAENYPEKRILAHYMQPHYPFLGPSSEEHFDKKSLAFWIDIMTGEQEISDDLLWSAFCETLDVSIPDIQCIVTKLDGKTVISSDHGQMVGERARPFPIREYGHPHNIYTSELVHIPWFVCEYETRRVITAEEPAVVEGKITSDVKERLRNFGYIE